MTAPESVKGVRTLLDKVHKFLSSATTDRDDVPCEDYGFDMSMWTVGDFRDFGRGLELMLERYAGDEAIDAQVTQ